jgi:hypothetical protein
MDRLKSAWAWVRRSPMRTASVGGAAIAAIGAGAVFAVVVNEMRAPTTAGDAVPASTLPSTIPTTPGPTLVPMPAEEPTPTASLDPTAAPPTPAPTVLSTPPPVATARPTPSGGHGGVGGGGSELVYDINGTWERLPDMPGGDDFRVSDSVLLPDGRIVVFRWDYGYEDPDWPEVVIYDPDARAWTPVEFDGDRPGIGTDQPFALAGDGQLYTHDYVIDISSEPWRVSPFLLVRESDVWAGMTLAAGPDGRVYRRADDTGSGRTQLIAYDPATDSFERGTVVTGAYDILRSSGDDLVLVGGAPGFRLITYDPAHDAWSPPVPVTPELPFGGRMLHAAVAGDRDVYTPGPFSDVPQLWAISLDDGSLRSMSVPDDALDWSVDLLWDGGGRLYVFGTDRAWVFTPAS